MTLKGVKEYFPDKYPKGRICDRTFLFDTVNTLHPNVIQEIYEHALK